MIILDEYFRHAIEICKMERPHWQKSQTRGHSPSNKCLCVRRVCPIRSRVKPAPPVYLGGTGQADIRSLYWFRCPMSNGRMNVM
ncbi:hypothetical protein TNCT_273571 [Trichonephila clavata]|uniref:Uncharacterized protein n=1 Tax=Trichonephila clavata TaxID=2740835 RepID=A0A8X6EXY4_TRICU|nr:hypothetical protein TNCT_273571 [Trichonephila clavata]